MTTFEYELATAQRDLAWARQEIRRLSHGHRIFAVQVRCDGCTAVVAFDPAPADEAMLVEALMALRWRLEGGHWCSRCVK